MRESSASASRGAEAEERVALLFRDAGWDVRREVQNSSGGPADLLVRRGQHSYIVDVKSASEGRADRLSPLWAQAYLVAARHAAAKGAEPLAVVAAPRIQKRVAQQVIKFAADYVPHAAVGVIDFQGLCLFRGRGLDALSRQPASLDSDASPGPLSDPHLFSHLNQWLLKVLLAPELPVSLLSSPRHHYRNASGLARAAGVPVMSAFRFVRQLQREGFLHESDRSLRLVRRADLFRRWQAAASLRPVKEVPMRSVLPGRPDDHVQRLLEEPPNCLGLFAAARAHKLGFVEGVPPHVYVSRVDQVALARSKHLLPVVPGEIPDVILRQAYAPRSIFEAAVRDDGPPRSDILQVWLDVSAHPARGAEQAEHIYRRVIEPLAKPE